MAKKSMQEAGKSIENQIVDLQNNQGKLDEDRKEGMANYHPNKRKRAIRRQVYSRFYELRDDPGRKEAEAQ
jgi:hypothetical protein